MDQNDELWAWAEFLKAPNSLNLESIQEEIVSISNAKKIFNKTNSNSVEREKMRLLEKTQMDNFSAIATARDDGRKEGKEEGLVEGENRAKIETAKNFLKIGLSVEQVAMGTGLSMDIIKSLKSQ